jgi:hypothetical protein
MAFGGTTAILWVICSALVALLPGVSLTMSGHMLHMDVSTYTWTLTLGGFLFGLIIWTICAAVAGWLIALIYNATGGSGSV